MWRDTERHRSAQTDREIETERIPDVRVAIISFMPWLRRGDGAEGKEI